MSEAYLAHYLKFVLAGLRNGVFQPVKVEWPVE